MKLLMLIAATTAIISFAPNACNKNSSNEKCYKGKLEIKALCMNYTIKLLEGEMDTSSIAAQWTDEHTGKSYTNVFSLGSPCTFPPGINEGDEFYFTIDTTTKQDCAVCMAYYPKPAKQLAIKILPGACK
jgi:hypothetical protein